MRAAYQMFLIWALAAWAAFAMADLGLSDQESQLLIQSFLKSKEVIRLGFETGPGLGHQTTAVSVVRGLRRLGYEGWIEIVYNPSPKPKPETDLALLFPEFTAQGGPLQQNEVSRLRFISLDHFKGNIHSHPEVDLGLLGADDHSRKPSDLRVRALITLQPMGWHAKSKIQILYPIREPVISLEHLNELGFISESKSLDQVRPEHFSREGLGQNKNFDVKINHLKHLLELSERVDLAPYYGHGYYSATMQLETYLRAIRQSQLLAPDLFQTGVVVPIFADSPFYDRQTTRDLQKNSDLAAHTQTIAIDDPRFAQAIQGLQANQILVVYAGRVPRDVFELFFEKARIPPVVGGRNSLNFMRQVAHPYLTSSHRVRFEFQPGSVHQHAESTALLAEQAMLSESRPEEADLMNLSDFITQAKRRDSELNKLFRENSLSKGTQQDKLAQSLLVAIKHWDQVGASSKPALARWLNQFGKNCAKLLTGL